MKKIGLILIFALCAISAHSIEPSEFPDFATSNKNYYDLLGYMYKKGNTKGLVFYVSPDAKTMVIVNRRERIITYPEAERYCAKYGLHIPNVKEMKLLCENAIVFFYYYIKNAERFGYEPKGVFPYLDYFWTSEYANEKELYCISPWKYGHRGTNREDTYSVVTAPIDSPYNESGYNVLTVIGVKTVPFEPQYLSPVADF